MSVCNNAFCKKRRHEKRIFMYEKTSANYDVQNNEKQGENETLFMYGITHFDKSTGQLSISQKRCQH